MRKDEFPIVDEYCRRAKIEELKNIKEKIDIECDSVDSALDVIIKRIAELKGEEK